MKDLTKSMEMSEKFEKDGEESSRSETSAAPTSINESDKDKLHATEAEPKVRTPSEEARYHAEVRDYERRAGEPPSTPSTTSSAQPSHEHHGASASQSNPYSQQRPTGIPTRPAIMDRSEEEARLEAAGVSEAEKDLRAKERKKGLTKEQKAELMAYEAERQRVRDERVNNLAKKLVERLSVWTETDRGGDVTRAFKEKTRLETENLKMESFGLEMLHSIGAVYVNKGSNFAKSNSNFLGGIGGFFSRVKDKGSQVKDVFGTISSALDAQQSMEEMARAEERGGDAWTDEARAEAERRVTGKILAAAWRGSKFEIQSVLRDVCDRVLKDDAVGMQKRIHRAHALVIMGGVLKEAKRDDDEEREYMVFEQLMADAAKKREDKEDAKKKEKKEREKSDESAEGGGTKGKSHFAFGGGHKSS